MAWHSSWCSVSPACSSANHCNYSWRTLRCHPCELYGTAQRELASADAQSVFIGDKTLTRDCFFLGLSPPFPIGRVASKRHAARDHYAASRPVRQPECVPAPSCHIRGEQRAPLRCMTWRCSAGCLSRRAPRSRWRRLTALRACAVGYEFWKQLCLEHGITQDGLIRDDIEVDSTGVAGDRKDVFVSRVVSLR